MLFMISHASFEHLGMNLISLVLVWLMAHKVNEREGRLLGVFFASSILPLFIPILFSQPIIGASAGVFGMIGYLLPDMQNVIPLPVSYFLMFPVILLEGCFLCNPWSKLFHIFGLTIGVILHYMFDMHSLGLRKTALKLSLGSDYYSLIGLGYHVTYNLPQDNLKKSHPNGKIKKI
ncbi:MAG: rhomboid family intramembrane serine protease [Candidatus Altiarchaeota archaeon]|nr:rhomboid family intramembrane serine protease [Candidatus Altiarchaeota archaeon]